MTDASEAGFYSRYKGTEEGERGESMMEKHLKRKAIENKEAALQTLRAVWPQLKPEMLITALEGNNWDADKAYKDFELSCNLLVLPTFDITKPKTKEKSHKAEKDKKRKHSKKDESDSDSESGSSSGGSDDSDSDHKSRKHKKHKKEKHKKKKSKKEKRSKDKEKDKDADVEKKGAVTDQFGLYGVIKESDMWNKQPEFNLWCAEVKHVNLELLSKWEEKDCFKEFMEDYNTATLPHKKFYNYEAWLVQERQKEMRKSKKGGKQEKTTFNDEEDKKREMVQMRMKARADEVNQLRHTMKTSGLAADMREQEMLREEMSHAYKIGDLVAARKLAARLAPDEG